MSRRPRRHHFTLRAGKLKRGAQAETEKLDFMALRGYAVQTIHGASLEGLAEYPEGNVLFISHL